MGEVVVGAPAVDECGTRLVVDADHVFRVKYDRSGAGQSEYIESFLNGTR